MSPPHGEIVFGTSGFSFADWVGTFYPEGTRQGDMLAYYVTRFRALELNVTYYRIPPPTTVERLEAKTPDGFVSLMRTAFVELWKDPRFIRDYANAVKTEPILVTGSEGQGILAAIGRVKPEVKAFLVDYSNRLVK